MYKETLGFQERHAKERKRFEQELQKQKETMEWIKIQEQQTTGHLIGEMEFLKQQKEQVGS